jgi:hypothetical protein
MERSDTPPPAGFSQAEQLEAMTAAGGHRRHESKLRDLVCLGDFLAPELHRQHGAEEAATAVREWADDDVEMIAEAETVARHQHHDYSAEILRRARALSAA